MRILHLSGGYPSSGAGLGAVALDRAMQDCGMNSRIRFPRDRSGISRASLPGLTGQFAVMANRLVSQAIQAPDHRQINVVPFTPPARWLADEIASADIVHVHWTSDGAVDLAGLAKAGRRVVVTLRDMWSLTAGCGYDLGCTGRERGCSKCPAVKPFARKWLANRVYPRRVITPTDNVRWIAISRWLRDEARRAGALARCEVDWIPNITAREFELAAPPAGPGVGQPPLLVAGALNLDDPYKNIDALAELWPLVAAGVCRIAVFGHGGERLRRSAPDGVEFVGMVGKQALVDLLSRGSGFISTSRQEAFGKTALEAAFAGLPVIAYADTGTADIVEDGVTGFLATYGRQDSLAMAVGALLGPDTDRPMMGQASRRRADEMFTGREVALRYRRLYEQMMESVANG